MAKERAAYDTAVRMHEKDRRLPKPRPEAFGLTEADLTAPAEPDAEANAVSARLASMAARTDLPPTAIGWPQDGGPDA